MSTLSPLTRASIAFFATVTFAFASAAAMAAEATQLEVPPSTLTRADVTAELARTGEQPGGVVQIGDATVFVDAIPASRSREAVRAEARQAARDRLFGALYLGA